MGYSDGYVPNLVDFDTNEGLHMTPRPPTFSVLDISSSKSRRTHDARQSTCALAFESKASTHSSIGQRLLNFTCIAAAHDVGVTFDGVARQVKGSNKLGEHND